MEGMILAQFVVSYYRKRSHQKTIIDPLTDVGADSREAMVGGGGRMPTCMQLSNKLILKMRSGESRPVPLLLGSNSLDAYGERMLFRPWRRIEDLSQESTEEQRLLQQQNRLALFPMSIFPRFEEGSGKYKEKLKGAVLTCFNGRHTLLLQASLTAITPPCLMEAMGTERYIKSSYSTLQITMTFLIIYTSKR